MAGLRYITDKTPGEDTDVEANIKAAIAQVVSQAFAVPSPGWSWGGGIAQAIGLRVGGHLHRPATGSTQAAA